jgi:uncharacterized protein (TIGR03083 family)
VDIHSRTAANRLLLADFFDGLDDAQLATRSLCEEWSVRGVLGHLVATMTGSLGGLLLDVVRAKGSINGANAAMARRTAERPVSELTSILREQADGHGTAPGVGPMGQLADGCLHLRDCARPLGLDTDVCLDDWRTVLDWMPGGVPGLVPKRRVEGLALRATDQEWGWGSGAEVAGRSEALAMAVAGRPDALGDLTGTGVDLLRGRIEGRR